MLWLNIGKLALAAAVVTFWAFCMSMSLYLAGKFTKWADKSQKESLETTLGFSHLADDVVALAKMEKLPNSPFL